MLRTAFFIVVLTFSASGSPAQQNRFEVSPALLRSDATTTVGLRWHVQRAMGGPFHGDRFPSRLQAKLATRGAAALDPKANPEPLEVSGAAGWFVALFAPPTDRDPTDPDAVPEGGFDFGSIDVSAAAALESDQKFEEVNGVFGGRFAYVVSRQDYPWPLVPALQVQFAAVVPVATRLATDLDLHSRFDVNAAWHFPILATPVTLHANLWYWNASGLDPTASAARTPDGIFGSISLGYDLGMSLSDLVLHEVFVRWSGGEAPIRSAERNAWMIGVVVGR